MAYGDALAAEHRVDGDVPVMSSGGVSGVHARANTQGPTIVIGRKGTYGSVYWSAVPAFVIDTAYYIDSRLTDVNLRWLYYVLHAVDLRGISQDVGVPGLSRDAAYHVLVPKPPQLHEQRRIADFLDDQVARLDRAIELRQRHSDLTYERLEVRWATAILAAAPMTEWLPLRRFIMDISDGPFGSSLMSSHYEDQGARVVRLGNVGRVDFVDEDRVFVSDSYYWQLRRHSVLPGDVIIAGLGDAGHPVGRACIVPPSFGRGIVKADCFRLRLDQRRVLHHYAAAVLSSRPVTSRTRLLSKGSTRARINLEAAREIRIPVPTLHAQRAIVGIVAEAREHAAGLCELIERQIGLLRERKQALITAAVTGEFDVSAARTVG